MSAESADDRLVSHSSATKLGVDFGKRSEDYSEHRPGFPSSFYNRLERFVAFSNATALDVGTGPGIVALELAQRVAAEGVCRLLYTDISRDGTLTEPNFEANAGLVRDTGLAVLASGGIASVEHIRRLAGTGVEGVILGRALYAGALRLPEALAAAGE